jgi:hypothetical protein
VYFHCKIKVRERVETGAFEASEKRALSLRKGGPVADEPLAKQREEAVSRMFSGGFVKLPIHSGVGKVITEGEANIFLAFDHSWAHILVALGNYNVVLGAKRLPGKALVTQ